MDDLRTGLDRIATRVEDRPDAFARLERRRRARSRGRRLTAGFLGMVIAVLGTVTAYSVFSTPRLQLPGGPGGQIAALWPEHDADQVRATQEAVDAGDTMMEWRLDAEETGVRFVRSVLGWPSPDERLVHNAVRAPNGMVTVDVTTVPNSCVEGNCVGERDVIVQLLQFGDEDGIWSVISAESSSFNMQFPIGRSVHLGDELDVISGHPSGSEITVGVKVFEPCSGFRGGTASVHLHRVIVPIQGVDEGCLGYVYALTPGTTSNGVEVGRTLFDDDSGSDRTIDDIAVAPVFIVAPGGSGSVSEVPQPEEV